MEEKTTTYRFKNIEEYKEALNKAPSSSMIKERSIGDNKFSKYVPIAVQEAFADLLFREWNVIDESFNQCVNEVVFKVKIQYLPDYPGADYQFCSGSGAKPILQVSKSGAENFPKGKISNALEFCLPAARSNAKANAFSDLGNVFGRNVNRGVDNGFHIYIRGDERK